MYLVCQRCDLRITPLRLGEPVKMKNKQTNKPQKLTKHLIKQTNQPTPYYFTHPEHLDIFGHILIFRKVFSFTLLFCLMNL